MTVIAAAYYVDTPEHRATGVFATRGPGNVVVVADAATGREILRTTTDHPRWWADRRLIAMIEELIEASPLVLHHVTEV